LRKLYFKTQCGGAAKTVGLKISGLPGLH
jgi:hypothetical protein